MHGPRSEPFDAFAVERAASLVEQADALIVAAGAGMGVDSGLPDFRGKDGFWRAYPALRKAQIDFYSISRLPQPSTRRPNVPGASMVIAWPCIGRRRRITATTY